MADGPITGTMSGYLHVPFNANVEGGMESHVKMLLILVLYMAGNASTGSILRLLNGSEQLKLLPYLITLSVP